MPACWAFLRSSSAACEGKLSPTLESQATAESRWEAGSTSPAATSRGLRLAEDLGEAVRARTLDVLGC
jgi:hypothetical protein